MEEQPLPRVFSIEEANALVPRLAEIVADQIERGEEIEERIRSLLELKGSEPGEQRSEILDVTAYPSDSDAVKDAKSELRELVDTYRDGWKAVEDLGAVIKDTAAGLLDFYGRIDDRLVWLCWRYGEDTIDYYHELDSGFAGRKSLATVRKRMLN